MQNVDKPIVLHLQDTIELFIRKRIGNDRKYFSAMQTHF